jgi:copper homeostasis protein CutC
VHVLAALCVRWADRDLALLCFLGLFLFRTQGAEAIADLVKRAKGRIAVMAGSGVSASNAAELMHKTGCTELHSSARK